MKEIANKIKQAEGHLYLVGGAVRDKFLNKNNHDEDYCVTGITAQEFQKLFPQAHVRGKSFEVFDIEGKEFAMARTETKKGKGHKEFEIQTGEHITIQEDLARRDITINSMAQDVLTGEIIDPYHGQDDIKNKIIRATTKKFKEDPLRVYRVARFAAQFTGFEVEEQTLKMMEELKGELSSLSKERVFKEFEKALATEKPSIFFEVLKKSNVLDIHFQPIFKLIGALQPEKYHPEGDSYNHTMLALDQSAKYTQDLKIRYATLVHDLGKGLTPKEQYPHHYNHEVTGVPVVAEFSRNIGAPNAWRKCGQTACREHMRGGIFYKMKPSKKVEFIERIDKSYLGLHGLQIVVNCDRARGIEVEEVDRKFEDYQFEEIGKRCLEEVNAKKVAKKYGLKEGVELGKKLHEERVRWMRDKWGRFLNVPLGHLRTVPECPKGTKKNRPHLSLDKNQKKVYHKHMNNYSHVQK